MLRHRVVVIAVAIVIGWCISASAFAGNIGNVAGNPGNGGFGGGHGIPFVGGGSGFHNRGGEFHDFSGRSFIGVRFWRGYGIGVYPYADIGTPYLEYGDYESGCGFFWVDRIFGQRIIRQRVYTCP